MSSILDALRKLEQEKVEITHPEPVEMSEDIAERDLIGGTVGGRGMTLHLPPSVLLVAGLVVGLLLAAGSVGGTMLWMRATASAQEPSPAVQVASVIPAAPLLAENELETVPAEPQPPTEPVALVTAVDTDDTPVEEPTPAKVEPAPAKPTPTREREERVERATPRPRAEKPRPAPEPVKIEPEPEPYAVAQAPSFEPEPYTTVSAQSPEPAFSDEPVFAESEPLVRSIEPAAPQASGAMQAGARSTALPPTPEDRQRIKLNMPRPASKQRPYASAIINLQPVFINDEIPGTNARLVGVTESGIEYINQDTGARHYMSF